MTLYYILNVASTSLPSLRIGKRLIGCFVNHNVGNHQWPAPLKITRAFHIQNAVCPLNYAILINSVRSDLFGNGIQISLQDFWRREVRAVVFDQVDECARCMRIISAFERKFSRVS